MDTVESTALWQRADRGVVQLLGQQRDSGNHERSMRAYQAQQKSPADEPGEPAPADAPVSLELSGTAHALQVYANYDEGPVRGPLRVRIVDAETTETVREMTVSDADMYRPRTDDSGRLRPGTAGP